MKLFLTFLLTLAANQLFAQSKPSPDAKDMPNRCAADARLGDLSGGPAWNGWGVDSSNTRFQTAKTAGLTAAQVPQLKLKWALDSPARKLSSDSPRLQAGESFSGSIPVMSMRSTPRAVASTGRLKPGQACIPQSRSSGSTKRPWHFSAI